MELTDAPRGLGVAYDGLVAFKANNWQTAVPITGATGWSNKLVGW